jgi:hypothetical protein
MYEGVIDKIEGKQGAKESQVHIKLLQPIKTRSHAVRTSILAGGRPSCLDGVRAKICTELRSVSEPEKDTALL